MKKRLISVITLILLVAIGYTANAANPSQYLRSRLTVLSAKLYQEFNNVVDQGTDYYYTIGFLPTMDINSNNPVLATYLYKQMEEVLVSFPALRLAAEVDATKAWEEFRKQGLPEEKLFQKVGQKLNVSGLVLTSIVAHPTYYTINGMVVNAKNGKHEEVELVVLERAMIDTISADEMKAFINSFTLTGTITASAGTANTGSNAQTPTNSSKGQQGSTQKPSTGSQQQSGTQPANTGTQGQQGSTQKPSTGSQQQSGTQPANTGTQGQQGSTQKPSTGSQQQSGTQPANSGTQGQQGTQKPSTGSQQQSGTQPASGNSSTNSAGSLTPGVDSSSSTGQQTTSGGETPATDPANPTADEGTPGADEGATGVVAKPTLKLIGQSVLMSNMLFSFALGDVNGDGLDELISFIGGQNIQVRNLTNYAINYTYNKYSPQDFNILTTDLDGDGRDEIITFGYLIKLENGNLVTKQNRFNSRPVSLYDKAGLNLFNQNSILRVNYQGLVSKQYKLGATAKRLLFADLNGDGSEELVCVMDGQAENAEVRIYRVGNTTVQDPIVLDTRAGFALVALDLNANGRPEIYLKRSYFNGDQFLYSKIYAYEYNDGKYTLLYESPNLDYYIVDFSAYPTDNPTKLVVGGMYLKNKKQSPSEVKSRLFFYTFQ